MSDGSTMMTLAEGERAVDEARPVGRFVVVFRPFVDLGFLEVVRGPLVDFGGLMDVCFVGLIDVCFVGLIEVFEALVDAADATQARS